MTSKTSWHCGTGGLSCTRTARDCFVRRSSLAPTSSSSNSLLVFHRNVTCNSLYVNLHASPVTSNSSSKLSSRTPILVQSHHICTACPQQRTCFGSLTRGSKSWGQGLRDASRCNRKHSLTPAAAIPSRVVPNESDGNSHTAVLIREGFSLVQTLRVLKFYSTQPKLCFDIDRVREWQQLLLRSHVLDTAETLSKNTILLQGRAESSARSAQEVLGWLFSIGLTESEVRKKITGWPLLLRISHENLMGVSEWMRSDLGWTEAMIRTAFEKNPRLFSYRPSNLAPKLEWYRSTGFSAAAASKALYIVPTLFGKSVEHNQAQVMALCATGLTPSQTLALILKMPSVLGLDILGVNQQAKIRFLTQVMGGSVADLDNCSAFLGYSLADRIGPRWAFHNRYCLDQPRLKLTRMLQLADEDFTEMAFFKTSSLLQHECNSCGLNRLEVFYKFREQWKQGEGSEWVIKKEKGSKKTRSAQQHLVDSGTEADEAWADDSTAADSS